MRRTRSASDLRAIARYQKVLILCLLGELFLWVGYIAASVTGLELGDDSGSPAVMVLTGLVGLAAGVVVFLLSLKVSGLGAGLILGLLTAVPCFGLIMILIVNTQATSTLRANGLRVGLLGASLADIAELPEEPDAEDEQEEDEYRPRRRPRRDPSEVNEEEGW